MLLHTTDSSGNRNDKIANAAKVIGRSEDRRKVFEAIYRGKRTKSVDDIASATGLNNVRVLQEAKKLVSEDMVIQIGKRQISYEKIDFYTQNKTRILALSTSKEKLAKFPTKTNPQTEVRVITARYEKRFVDHKFVSIDDIDSFSKVRKVKSPQLGERLYEEKIKNGFRKIVGEEGTFIDWGGESDDLYSTRLLLNKKRYRVAFAFKGRATTGILTPKKMGKNGDQIQRLFTTPAEVFFIAYQGQIDESVVTQMQQFAIAKSVMESKRVYFGIIDAKDMARIISAYPEAFV